MLVSEESTVGVTKKTVEPAPPTPEPKPTPKKDFRSHLDIVGFLFAILGIAGWCF